MRLPTGAARCAVEQRSAAHQLFQPTCDKTSNPIRTSFRLAIANYLMLLFISPFLLLLIHVSCDLDLLDLVSVLPTSDGNRLKLVHATRSWRFGIPTFITMNNSMEAGHQNKLFGQIFNEHYSYYPDEEYTKESKKKGLFHGARAGDVRSAISPFLAHAHIVAQEKLLSDSHGNRGPYKWMLYGQIMLLKTVLVEL